MDNQIALAIIARLQVIHSDQIIIAYTKNAVYINQDIPKIHKNRVLASYPGAIEINDLQQITDDFIKVTVYDPASRCLEKVLGSMFDGIEFRGFAQETVETLAQYAGVPIWNGLTDLWHPTQTIADFMTIKEHFGHLEGLKLVYCGDGRNNMANSLLVTSALLGVNVAIVSPKKLLPSQAIVEVAQQFVLESGSQIELTDEIAQGVKGADILYTDVWVSMGEEAQMATRIKEVLPYQVNAELVDLTDNKDHLIFLHCLPAFHDLQTKTAQEVFEQFGMKEMEVTDEVFQASYARQFIQAENRMHAIKAIMAATLGHLFIPKV